MIRLGERFCGRESFTAKALGILPSYNIYRKTYALLKRSRRWSPEELAAYQAQALSRLLEHAYENVPYYRRVFQERGLVPGDIQA
ncbi:MAG: CoF synthetase, partial [Methanomicrobiales archaeon HGW-Methanomicrobiales-6]